MNRPTPAWTKELLADHATPCVSVYMPTQRAKPPAAENPRLFHDLVERATKVAEQTYPKKAAREVIGRLTSLVPEDGFWTGDRDGVAFFASPDYARAIDLRGRIDPSVHVADTFHIKPLIRLTQTSRGYHLLALTLHRVDIYEGTDVTFTRLDPRQIPQDPAVVAQLRLGHEADPANEVVIAGEVAHPPNEGSAAVASTEEFMRAVDRVVWEEFSRREQIPLILAAVERDHPLFHSVSKNPYLQAQGVRHDPKQMDPQRLHRESWPIIEAQLRGQIEQVKDLFRTAKAHDRGSDEVPVVAQAAAEGRVGTLLVDQDAQVPGRVHPFSGMIEQPTPGDPRSDDILDDVAAIVLKRDGAVLVLPHDQMPSDQGIAAIYRY